MPDFRTAVPVDPESPVWMCDSDTFEGIKIEKIARVVGQARFRLTPLLKKTELRADQTIEPDGRYWTPAVKLPDHDVPNSFISKHDDWMKAFIAVQFNTPVVFGERVTSEPSALIAFHDVAWLVEWDSPMRIDGLVINQDHIDPILWPYARYSTVLARKELFASRTRPVRSRGLDLVREAFGVDYLAEIKVRDDEPEPG